MYKATACYLPVTLKMQDWTMQDWNKGPDNAITDRTVTRRVLLESSSIGYSSTANHFIQVQLTVQQH